MRKFKIKNRKKRRYRRRQATSNYSLSKTVYIGFIPSIIIAIALFAAIYIKIQPVNHQISLPQIPAPSETFSGSIHLIYSDFVQTISSIVLPRSLPSKPTIISSNIDTSIVYKVFISFRDSMVAIKSIMTSILTKVYWLTGGIMKQIQHMLVMMGSAIWKGFVSVYNWLASGFQFIARSLHSFLYFLGTPFRIIAQYYEEWKPLLIKIGRHTKRTAEHLARTTKLLVNVIIYVIETSKRSQ